jgi:hypothetical protein
VRSLVADDWVGVMADNDMQTLGWYSTARLQGTTSAGASDAKLRVGFQALIGVAGPAVNSTGGLLIPNVSDGRLDLVRWNTATAYGGGMEEQFTHWGTDVGSGFLTDWGPTGWVDQTSELAAQLTLTVTRSAPGDLQPLRYGYASALIRARGRVAWTPSTTGT